MVPPLAADEWDEGDAEKNPDEGDHAPDGHYDVYLVADGLSVLATVGGGGGGPVGLAVLLFCSGGAARRGG